MQIIYIQNNNAWVRFLDNQIVILPLCKVASHVSNGFIH